MFRHWHFLIRYTNHWNSQFIDTIIIIKTNNFPQAKVTLAHCANSVEAFGFLSLQRLLNYLAFQPFDLEHAWWRFLQKRVVRTNLDIYVFIHIPHSFITCYDCQVYSFKFYVLLFFLCGGYRNYICSFPFWLYSPWSADMTVQNCRAMWREVCRYQRDNQKP